MNLIRAVYDALRSFDRPCTRAEIEEEAGLGKDDVREGLRGLQRRAQLVIVGSERQLTQYQLVPCAIPPVDLRGKHAQTEATRARIAEAQRRNRAKPDIVSLDASPRPAGYRASKPPSHHAEPGALRTVKKGLALGGSHAPISRCLLADHWRKKR